MFRFQFPRFLPVYPENLSRPLSKRANSCLKKVVIQKAECFQKLEISVFKYTKVKKSRVKKDVHVATLNSKHILIAIAASVSIG